MIGRLAGTFAFSESRHPLHNDLATSDSNEKRFFFFFSLESN